MSISSDIARVAYTLTGSGQTLTVNFKFLAAVDLGVISTRAGVDTTLLLNTDYTVTGGGSLPGTGAVVMVAGVSGDIITIYRNAQILQPAVYAANDAFPAKTTETSLDRSTMTVQQLALLVNRSLRIPVSAGSTADLGDVAARSGRVVGFDASGNASLYDPAAAVFATGSVIEVSSVAALKAVSVASLITGMQARTSGYATSADGGDGLFVYNSSSSATQDFGTVVQPNSGSGRWLRAYSGAVNVKWFGAKGDNATDDTAAIQGAITALGGSPGQVFVPTGNYSIAGSSAIFTLAKGQEIVGASLGNAAVGGTRIFYGGSGTLVTLDINCRLADLQFYGAGTVVGGSVGVAFVANASRWVFENVKVYNFAKGIKFDTCYIGTLVNVLVAHNTVGCSIENSQVNNIHFIGGAIESNVTYGVQVGTGPHTGIGFIGTAIEGNTTAGIYVATTNNSNNFLDGFRVDGCYFESNGDGADAGTDIIFNSPYGRAPTFVGNTFTNTHTCLTLTAATRPIVQGNSFRPGGTLGTRKSLTLAAGVGEAMIGSNWYETGAFTPSTDDSGSNTVLYEADRFRPPPLPNGTFLQGKRNTSGTTINAFGFPASADYLQLNAGTTASGSAAYILLDGNGTEIFRLNAVTGGIQVASGPKILFGSGTPEGNVSAVVGSIYGRTNGGASTSFYVKESGSSNVGWVAK